ncbi:MAG: hypothetical protein U0031_02060 [Thermomicrobiales bacterium]
MSERQDKPVTTRRAALLAGLGALLGVGAAAVAGESSIAKRRKNRHNQNSSNATSTGTGGPGGAGGAGGNACIPSPCPSGL